MKPFFFKNKKVKKVKWKSGLGEKVPKRVIIYSFHHFKSIIKI